MINERVDTNGVPNEQDERFAHLRDEYNINIENGVNLFPNMTLPNQIQQQAQVPLVVSITDEDSLAYVRGLNIRSFTRGITAWDQIKIEFEVIRDWLVETFRPDRLSDLILTVWEKTFGGCSRGN